MKRQINVGGGYIEKCMNINFNMNIKFKAFEYFEI